MVENPDFVNVSKYVDMPKSVEYKLTGFVNNLKLRFIVRQEVKSLSM